MKGQRLAITLPPQYASLLRTLAKEQKMTISQVLCVLIDKLIHDTLENQKLGKEKVQ